MLAREFTEMKRKASAQQPKGQRKGKKPKTRSGFSSVARTRGAAVQGEMKYFDTLLTATSLVASADWTATEFDSTTTGTFFCPSVGAAVNQRIGKSAKVMKLKIHGAINVAAQTDQTAADSACQVRMLLVQDTQTNSTQMQGEQVMTPPATATALLAVNSFQNIDNFGRFKVLKDKTFTIQNPNFSWDGTNIEQTGLIKPFKFSVNFSKNPVVVRFNNTNGGTFADIIDNSFHLLVNISNAGLVPTINWQCRTCFKE